MTDETTQIAEQPASLKAIITSERMKEQFAAALPSHLSPARFCRIAITALTRAPKLLECTQASVMKCLLDLSAMGLEPDGRRAHLIPYGTTCTLILDWKGIAELALRSGMIAKLHADTVCENDAFTYDMGEVTSHVINWKAPRGPMYAAYAMAQTKTGEKFFAVMSKDEIDAIRKRSKSGQSGPWVTDYDEMAKKTAFRRLSKWLPLSADFRDAVDHDGDGELATVAQSSREPAASMPASLRKDKAQDAVVMSEAASAVIDLLAKAKFTAGDYASAVSARLGEALDFDGISDETHRESLENWGETVQAIEQGGRR